jgi:excisionase family DNA binding protein
VARKDEQSDVMTATEVGAFLGLSRNSVYEGASRGEIPCRKVGRRLLFSRSALVLWLRHERAVPESESSYAGVP